MASERRRRGRNFRLESLRPALLALLVVGSVLALGSQHVWALVALGIAGTLLAALSLHDAWPSPRLSWLLAALIAYTLLQLVPLPFGAVQRLSPAAAELWAAAAKLLGKAAPGFVPLTVDPQATSLEVLKWWTYLGAFLGAVALRRSRGPLALANLLFVSSALVALVTLLHGAFDWQRVYGLYQPSFATDRWQRGPLLNSNNLAAYLNLGLGVTAGLLASGKTSLPRWLLTLGALAMAISVLLSGSRGGLIVMVLSGLGFCAALIWSSGLGEKTRRLVLSVAAVALAAAAIALAIAGDRLVVEWLGQETSRKVAAWRWTLDLLASYPAFGVGRGAYETAFPMYRGYLGYDWTSVFAYPENLGLQWLSEWGWAIGGAGLVALGWLLVKSWRRALRARLTLGLAVGVSAVLLQNAVDLSSEVAGVMLAVIVAMAALTGAGDQVPSRRELRPRRALALALVGAAVVSLGLARGRHPAHEERAALAREYRDLDATDRAARSRFRELLHDAILRHPGDPYLPLLGGLVAHRAGDQNSLAWLGHALTLGPTTGTVHLALADVLSARGAPGQAILHLRLASQYDATLRGGAALRAARWARDVAELERAFPAGEVGTNQLAIACPKLPAAERVVECWRRVAERSPGELEPLEELAEQLAAAVRGKSAPCMDGAAGACEPEVAGIARALEARHTSSWRVHAAHAEIIDEPLRKRQAAQKLIQHCPGGSDGEACLRRALSLARTVGDTGTLRQAIERFLAVACSGDAECADAHDLAAGEYTALNARALGLKHRQEAARAWPNATRWLAVADAALQSKALPTAEVALRRVESFTTLAEGERQELERLRAELRASAQDPGD